MKKDRLFILLILLLAFGLRFWRLGDYPALNADEAAIGYNAYSLIQTGMDEHGNSWPIHFQSFNDYKPGLYFYLVLPFVKFLGLSEWSVRIPNALFGVVTVYLIYLFGNLLFKDRKFGILNLEFGILPALMLAINPWHIHFSRGGWEVNTATFFMTLGVLCFLKAVNYKSDKRFLFFSSFAFVLSLYTYHAARIVSPLLVFGLLGIYCEQVRKNLKNVVLSGFMALVLLLPLANDLTQSGVLSRAAGVGLFADTGPINRINEQRGEHTNFNSISTKLLHNKLTNFSLAFFENWSAHYHGLFLFLSGDDIQRDKVPETGQMYIFDALWLAIGCWWLVKNWNKEIRVIIHWLVIAPVAAALTFQSPHALRAENMVIPLVIIVSIGLATFVDWSKVNINNKKILGTCFILLATLVFWQFARYQDLYWNHMTKEYPYSSQYGVKELVGYVSENENKFKNIIVTTKYDQPYILFLFYGAGKNNVDFDPFKFQSNHGLTSKDEFGFSTVPTFGKYIFKPINWEEDRLDYPNSMIIGAQGEIPKEANIVKKIYGTNGFEYFDVVAN